MNPKTAVLGSSGLITLTGTYESQYNPKAQYKVVGLTTIDGMSGLGIDVLTEVYLDYELTEEDYNTDLANNVDIITFNNEMLGTIVVPSSQVLHFTDQTTVPYHQAVISVSLGPMPDSYDYTNFKSELVEFCSDVSGVVDGVEAKLAVIDIADSVSYPEHVTMERVRKNNVKNRTTSRGRELTLQAEMEVLKQKLQLYGQIIKDNGFVLPN